ncbi:hypothetical protein IDE03_002112 [Enterococcus faecalis]|uniref:hypothetical protein n=1 Tax=Enterococcus TaxID=1350 RepID=UPI000CF1C61A|nr:hypothetical protein [Enterococcus faecalis]EGO2809102.1 hypothetical protein [Enterococcus faecalis]EGO6640898.1 hypothetical protein [Enterococcus faecalis]EGO6648524.1 hypothetical protein [Enterococcus faecalis]EGO6770361.1 hypothetical protein [Enterococcus faecalis]EGO7724381.1 hypothetical protein [Enterococcus faecalis]
MDEFNTELFNNFLVRRLQEKQKEPMSEFTQGAITELVHVSEMFNSMLQTNEKAESNGLDKEWKEEG